MEKLTESERKYLLAMPPWSNGISGATILRKIEGMEESYEFDANIPIEDLREHVQRLQERLRKIEQLAKEEL